MTDKVMKPANEGNQESCGANKSNATVPAMIEEQSVTMARAGSARRQGGLRGLSHPSSSIWAVYRLLLSIISLHFSSQQMIMNAGRSDFFSFWMEAQN